MDKELITVKLTSDEALVLQRSIQDCILTSSKIRVWPWKRTLGWIDVMIQSRAVYVSARDKLHKARAGIRNHE